MESKKERIEFKGKGLYKIQAPCDDFWEGVVWEGYVTKDTLDIYGNDLIEYLEKPKNKWKFWE